jgi:glutathione S-transferase
MPSGTKAMLALAAGRTGDALAQPLAALRDAFGKLEARLGRGGPFSLDRQFTLVDAAFAPFLRRWKAAEEWGDRDARILAGFPKLAAYVEALLSRPSVVRADPGNIGPRTRHFYAERAAKAS